LPAAVPTTTLRTLQKKVISTLIYRRRLQEEGNTIYFTSSNKNPDHQSSCQHTSWTPYTYTRNGHSLRMDYRHRQSHALNISNQRLYYRQHHNEVLPRVSRDIPTKSTTNQFFNKQSHTIISFNYTSLFKITFNNVTTLRLTGHLLYPTLVPLKNIETTATTCHQSRSLSGLTLQSTILHTKMTSQTRQFKTLLPFCQKKKKLGTRRLIPTIRE
jgi:hypothetical protein